MSLVTPFQDESISWSELEENMSKLNETPIRGYLALGGNAESMGMSEREKDEVLGTVVRLAGERDDKIVIGGIACESSYLAIERAKAMADTGAGYARILPPHYFASGMTPEVLIRFYEEVADHTPIPFILYNVPKLTGGVRVTPATVARLADHPKIAGIKDSSPDGVYGFLHATRHMEDFAVLAGSANTFFPALASGAAGGDMTLANYLPSLCCELLSSFERGDMGRARDLHLSIYTINKLVSGTYGVPGIKAAMDLLGYSGGEPRRPFAPLGNEGIAHIRETLEEEGLL